jgi:Trk K+ transport system NAD-binding subunit
VVLIDSNKNFIEKATNEGLEAFEINIYDDDLTDNIELNDIGYLIAMTGSDAVNQYALNNLSKEFGEHGAFRVATSDEVRNQNFEQEEIFFTPKDDYINLSEAVRDYPTIYEVSIKSKEEYQATLKKIHGQLETVPLFMIAKDKNIYLLSEFEAKNLPAEKAKLVYVGNKIV